MELYIKVLFWVFIINLVLKILEAGFLDWPKTTKKSLGSQCASIMETIAWATWAGVLLWIK